MINRFIGRASTGALLLVVVLALAGLYGADRLMRESERQAAQLDAVEAAALVESFLGVHAVAVDAMHGLFESADAPPPRAEVERLLGALGEHATGFRRVWIADSSGRIVYDIVRGAPAPSLPPDLDLDTLSTLRMHEVVRRARESRRTQVSAPGELFLGEPGFILLEPVVVGGRLAGFVGGSITTRALLASVPPAKRRRMIGMSVVAGKDTVLEAHWGATDTPYRIGRGVAVAPDGIGWAVESHRADTLRGTRATLWVMSLLVLAALTVGILHDRRQADRIAERSAELERLSTELLRANRSKSEFLANVSHELRTPLNAIVGFVDLLRDGVYGELNPRQAGPVARIEASATHLRHLVDQILDLAKMAAGRLEVHTEILDLRSFVLGVVAEMESLVNEKGLSLSVGIGATLPRVRTDPTHLRQIVVNLLGNAVKYTASGGVTIRARLVEGTGPPEAGRGDGAAAASRSPAWGSAPAAPDEEKRTWIALQVIDTGIGIAPADQARIFEEFEQVDAGPRGDSAARGTGLGLPISRRLARLLGGDVTLESEPGRGSAFTLWLPVHAADLRERPADGRRTPATGVVGAAPRTDGGSV